LVAGGIDLSGKERNLQFPFVRIVGQEDMKRALLLNIIDPGIGGVLLRGEKGTAKSTTVRSLEQILPQVRSIDGCQFHCNPDNQRDLCDDCRERMEKGDYTTSLRSMRVVELPLNATEDRISGSLDIEHVLRTGERKYEGGVLAQANGNLLYVDEVNLLDDHIVDLLLDSAAMGRNFVEREGISFSHPARFVLIGSMNPEEGTLRPQLMDRFGMCVDIKSESEADVRVEVIRRRLAFDADPEGYTAACQEETDALRQRLVDAKALVKKVEIPDDALFAIAQVSIGFKMEGHRADLAMIRAAKANAALEGRERIAFNDISTTAPLILRHRMKSGPFEDTLFRQADLDSILRGYMRS
jgi:magnesium chelatase subunit I